MIQKDPGFIVGPITKLLGVIFNFVFNFVHDITVANSLGISIIIITIIVRLLIWPLSIKQVKNSIAMQHLQPKINKLRQKYANNNKDPQNQKKFNLELQRLYAENNISPASGCIIGLFQLPMFMALNQLLVRSYYYISDIGTIYENLAKKIMSVPNYISIIKPIAIPKVPAKMTIDLSVMSDMQKVINKFTSSDWSNFLSHVSGNTHNELMTMLVKKQSVENFFGINLLDPCGLKFPGLMIPILATVTTFLTTYYMNKMVPKTDDTAKNQQKIMLILLPLMMGGVSFTLSSGVGVYWITSSVIQFVQQVLANKLYVNLREEK